MRTTKRKDNKRPNRARNRKSQSSCETTPDEVEFTEKTRKVNDASWYASSPELLNGAASFPWLSPVGAPWSINPGRSTGSGIFNNQVTPGIMTLTLMHTPGVSVDATSPINIAARNIYSWVRHANAGHANYEATDLMLYLMAMDDIYSLYSFLVRIYGVAQSYTQYNRYYPKYIVEAMHVDFEDILVNLADFRFFINTFANRIGSFAVPASMPFFIRHQWIYSSLFVDSISAKAQTYMYVPFGFRKYKEPTVSSIAERMADKKAGTAYTYSGYLEMNQFVTSANPKHNFESLKALANSLINAVSVSEDCNIMSGDILKAYGADGIFKLAPIAENYTVLPMYNPEVLSQFQNATICQPLLSATLEKWNIKQDPTSGSLIFDPIFENSKLSVFAEPFCGSRILNMYKDDVSPADTMVATRLTVTGKSYQDTQTKLHSAGSEICVGANIYTLRPGAGVIDNLSAGGYYQVYEGAGIMTAMNVLTAIEAFDFHPFIAQSLKYYTSGSTTAIYALVRSFQLNNYTVVDSSELEKMHETALLSMFEVPKVGTIGFKSK